MKKSTITFLFLISSFFVFSQKQYKNEDANFSFSYNKNWKINVIKKQLINQKLPKVKIIWEVIEITQSNLYYDVAKLRGYKKKNCFSFTSKTLLKGKIKTFDSNINLKKEICSQNNSPKEVEYVYNIGSNMIRFYSKLPKEHTNKQQEIETILESVSLITKENEK
jgi:hypothetical protein